MDNFREQLLMLIVGIFIGCMIRPNIDKGLAAIKPYVFGGIQNEQVTR